MSDLLVGPVRCSLFVGYRETRDFADTMIFVQGYGFFLNIDIKFHEVNSYSIL